MQIERGQPYLHAVVMIRMNLCEATFIRVDVLLDNLLYMSVSLIYCGIDLTMTILCPNFFSILLLTMLE